MPKIISLPPVDLNRDHLPSEIAALLEDFLKAKETAGGLHGELGRTPMYNEAYGELSEQHGQALEALEAAHTALSEATRRQPRQLQDSAAGAFGSHVDRARTLLVEAEQEMRAAAAAASLFATARARAGQPVLALNEKAVRTYWPRVQSMAAVSAIRETASKLPEDVEG
jgi:hypothetical protein